MPLSDEELARLCRRESSYFDQIVKRYAEKIHRYIARLIGLPWEIIILASLLIITLYFLTKNISTFYRNKNILVVALVISLFAGYLIAESSGLNEIIARTTPIKPIYRCRGQLIAPERFPIIVGEISAISKNQITIKDECKGSWTVLTSSETKIDTMLDIGKRVMVLGKKNNNQINVIEIKIFRGQRGFGNGNAPHRSSPAPMY